MSSTTAEVMLYLGSDNPDLENSINVIRFSQDPELTFREVMTIVAPIWDAGFVEGYEKGLEKK